MIWAKTNKAIARVLNIKLFRQRNRLKAQLSEINAWRKREDFPKFQKGKGYSGKELLDWGERFAAIIAPEKQRREAVAEILSSDKPSARAVKILSTVHLPSLGSFGATSSSQSTVGGDGSQKSEVRRQNVAAGTSGPIPSQQAMAVELQERYGFPIKRQAIQRWIHGIHLPAGAPRFPAPDPGRAGWNNPQPCYDWYEQWVIAPLRAAEKGNGQPMQMDLIGQKAADAQVAEYDKSIESAAIEKLKREALEREISEKWILRDDARATAARAISDVLRIVETEYERGAPQSRRGRLGALVEELKSLVVKELGSAGVDMGKFLEFLNSQTPQLLNSFSAWDLEEERERIDRIRAACAAKGG